MRLANLQQTNADLRDTNILDLESKDGSDDGFDAGERAVSESEGKAEFVGESSSSLGQKRSDQENVDYFNQWMTSLK